MNASEFPELKDDEALFAWSCYDDVAKALSYFDGAVEMFEHGHGEEWPVDEFYGEKVLKLFESSEVSPYYDDFTLTVVASRLPCSEPFIWFHTNDFAGQCSERRGEHDWSCNRIKVSTLRKVVEQRANLSPNEWATGMDASSRMSYPPGFIATIAALKRATLRNIVEQRVNLSPNEWAAGLSPEENELWKNAGRYVSGADTDRAEHAAWWAAWSKLYPDKCVLRGSWQSGNVPTKMGLPPAKNESPPS